MWFVLPDDGLVINFGDLFLQNIMILGDFNADGRYLPEKKAAKVSIHQPPYYWLIDEDADTTTSNNNDHTYDR